MPWAFETRFLLPHAAACVASDAMGKIDDIAKARRTVKLLPDPPEPLTGTGLSREVVDALLEPAGFAPFHRAAPAARGGEGAVEPWRVHALDKTGCAALIPRLNEMPKSPGKVVNMLAAADALLLVTWLPEEGRDWTASDLNMEHIAATGAMIQTLLLAATERGIGNYWSSGGVLADEAFDLLGIGREERLLGAIFLWPDAPEGVEAKPGKLRGQRRAPMHWTRWIEVPVS